jgi:hypothetical protein
MAGPPRHRRGSGSGRFEAERGDQARIGQNTERSHLRLAQKGWHARRLEDLYDAIPASVTAHPAATAVNHHRASLLRSTPFCDWTDTR